LETFRSTYIGFVFQSYNPISTLTAVKNIVFVIELAGWKREKTKRPLRKAAQADLFGALSQYLSVQLSGG